MYQKFYQRFLTANPKRQHFACHSHYYWPDVTRDAQLKYWDDSAKYVDEKWEHFFANCVPKLQTHIASILNIKHKDQIVFAPNTHELLYRLFSCFEFNRPIRILTTDSEFHSFSRQVARMEEAREVEVTRIPSQPFATFTQRFVEALKQDDYDMVFFSQVFFNSGVLVEDVEDIMAAVKSEDTLIVMDGYHGFMAKPTDLSQWSKRAFYLAGSYKYAQGGEGACFMVVPQECELRPIYTGWYAEFGELSKAKSGTVNYAKGAMRFAGATMDFSALYRLEAVLDLFASEAITVDKINDYIQHCQGAFLAILEDIQHPLINKNTLLLNDLDKHGHFFTFELPSAEDAKSLHELLRSNHILTDFRGNRLRFGFGLYHQVENYNLKCLSEHS